MLFRGASNQFDSRPLQMIEKRDDDDDDDDNCEWHREI